MQGFEQAATALKAAGVAVLANEPMARHTSFEIGGPAGLFCVPQDVGQLVKVIETARQHALPCFFLGKGTNLLFCDDGYTGIIVHIAAPLGRIEVAGNTIKAGAGACLAAVCEAAREAGLAGLEFAYGIPGSVGGAVYMDAGAYGGEMRQVLASVTYLDEEMVEHTIPAGECGFSYRSSIFQQKPWCVLGATFSLRAGHRDEIAKKMDEYIAQRREKQPLEWPSAGSAFKRPKGAFAGALIDQSGLRGHAVGGAAVSEKHCGFIVNLGGATCADVLALARHVEKTVFEKTGYKLEKEIRVVGRDGLA